MSFTTTVPTIPEVVTVARARFTDGSTRPVERRIRHLQALRSMITENDEEFIAALWDDLHKNAAEAHVTEIGVVLAEIEHTLRHVREWARPRRMPIPLALRPARGLVVPEPLGVVLVIAPWNLPVHLLLDPLVGVLAAGNTAVLKPSELAPATSRVMRKLIPRYFPDGTVQVVEGAVPETAELLEQRFDHIMFTGGGGIGRVVMRAAAEHLTPVTLELGGKSPAWFDDDANIDAAARKIAWGKFADVGQNCVAPDYVMTTPDRVPALVAALQKAITDMWGENPRTSGDYGRIVNERHFDRLIGYLKGTEIVIGGDHDRAERYLAPTVVTLPQQTHPVIGPDAAHPLLREEIFGPVLPIMPVDSVDQAIGIINGWDKPLSLYVFSSAPQILRRFIRETSSGSVVHNATIVQVAALNLPFGGVGASGIGAYHGTYSWRTFSHEKAVFDKPFSPNTLRLLEPPYSKLGVNLVRRLMRHG